ncbi:MAG: acyl-CoA dehydrogenase family protein [Syntrophales bacterium]|jgi:alkylation response protein AidB-like acyl-CoA dehydrogenase|nr:acyl-CoA dehydrogenase family protein [Syntrophales bacterium]
MDFRLTEEQIMIRDTIRRIATEKFAPLAAEIDAQERFPLENFNILAENGLLGVSIPEEYGGSGAGQLANCLVLEETAKACGSTSTILTNQGLASEPFLISASEEMKKNYLYRMASGQCQGAMAITEANAGSDVAGMNTTARKVDGGYLLNGSKIFITNVGISPFVVVVCYTDKSKGNKGMSLIVVEKEDKGFIVGPPEHKMGLRGSDTRSLTFEDCFVPENRLLGVEGGGFKTLMNTFNFSRPNIAAQALGFAQGALDVAVAYAKERVQFGQTLSSFQGMQWMLAEMALAVETARSITYRAASLIDNEPGSPEIPRLCSMAKWYASDVAMKVTTDAVQILGGYGYTREYPVERMMRDAKITQIYEGTNQVQRIIIAGQMLK